MILAFVAAVIIMAIRRIIKTIGFFFTAFKVSFGSVSYFILLTISIESATVRAVINVKCLLRQKNFIMIKQNIADYCHSRHRAGRPLNLSLSKPTS